MSPADMRGAAVEEIGNPQNLHIMRRPAAELTRAKTLMSVAP